LRSRKPKGSIGLTDMQRPRWGQIEGLRAVAATLVFLMHAWALMGGRTDRLIDAFGAETIRSVSPFFFHAGPTGVSLFYAISGLLLYTPFVRARRRGESLNLGSYMVRRAARIVPAYWLALVVIGIATGNEILFTPRGILDYFFFFELWTTLDFNHLLHPMTNDPFNLSHHVQFDVISGNPIGVAWTLCVEVSFYLFLPVWAWALAKLTSARTNPLRFEVAVIAAVMALSLIYKVSVLNRAVDIDFEPWLMILPNSIDIFAVGMLLALFAAHATDSDWPRLLRVAGQHPTTCWVLAAGVYVVVCLLESRWNSNPSKSWYPVDQDGMLHWQQGIWAEVNLVIAALLLAPIVVASERRSLVSRFLNLKAVAWVGLVSYGLYLWHVFVLDQITGLFKDDQVPLALVPLLTLVAYLMALGIAAASWYAIERRVLAAAHRSALLRLGRSKAGSS